MLKIDIPGRPPIKAEHLVLDYNGTLALDGKLLPEVADGINRLSKQLSIHILTADTHGTVAQEVRDLPLTLSIIAKDDQDEEKARYIRALDAQQVIAVGNGCNDLRMLKESGLGIGVIQQEGAYAKTLLEADVICTDITNAFGLLLSPTRLQATLRF